MRPRQRVGQPPGSHVRLPVALALAATLALTALPGTTSFGANGVPASPPSETGLSVGKPPGVEAAGELARGASQRLAGYGARWQQVLARLAANKPFGWLAGVASLALGIMLLFFGWALLRFAFPVLAVVTGCVAGGFLALEFVVVVRPEAGEVSQRLALALGAVLGAVILLGIAHNARPLAWMLMAAAPFLVASVLLYPVGAAGPVVAISCSAFGLAFGICLVFCWGLLTHLLSGGGARTLFALALERPLALLLCAVAGTSVGADYQFLFGPRDTAPPE